MLDKTKSGIEGGRRIVGAVRAVRLFLRRVVTEQVFPLELKVPNARTRAAIDESRAMMTRMPRFKSAQEMFDDLEKTSQ
ncbi:MAG: type II toxin-antitoxin system RelB/DinJ family antitoxin [Candidatus Accumulibacter sp.]|jgi:DNA-damage-inducible protein J|nr:type II toxin-antitoxin system RelB/DinJ family antitoxin [Accumulibacter sp.]